MTERETREEHVQDLLADGFTDVPGAAKFLALSRAKVYQLLDQGLLMSCKIGRSRRIPGKALIAFAKSALDSRSSI